MSFLQTLKTKKSKVEYILDRYPQTRHSDKELIMTYWKEVDRITELEEVLGATKAETIRRARQKFNQDGLYLPAKEVQLERKRYADEMRNDLYEE